MSGTNSEASASDQIVPLVRNNRNCTKPAPTATSKPNKMRPARESGVVFGSEIMLNVNWSSRPLCRRWSGIASGSPSHSERPKTMPA